MSGIDTGTFLGFKSKKEIKKFVSQNSVLSHHMAQSGHSLSLLFPTDELPMRTRSLDRVFILSGFNYLKVT